MRVRRMTTRRLYRFDNLQMALPTTIDHLAIDDLQNIVARLPALSFAFASCVSHSWNHVCGRVLCRPKLSSACSYKSSLQVAVEEVTSKVLSEPIRPQFAIASIGPLFDMDEAFQLITGKLSSKVPVIINRSYGIIGRDAISNEHKETAWEDNEDGARIGIMLTVGFVPDLKVKLIPLLKQTEAPRTHVVIPSQTLMIDQFITDIREFSTSISGYQSPAAVMIFSVIYADMGAVMGKMDYAMSPKTVIVGECGNGFKHTATKELATAAAVALVFVVDRNKPPGIGETRFHAVLSSGLSPVGATYEVDCVRENHFECTTHLTGIREGPFETFKVDELATRFIGVTKRRTCFIGQEEAKRMTSLSFHEVLENEENDELLVVDDLDIRTGDTYRFYHPDSSIARSTVDGVSNFLRSFKQRCTDGNETWEVCGGLIFTSCSRDVPFLGQSNADSSAFLENFPGVTFCGTICLEQIGRGYLIPQESQEQKSARACVHRYNAIYLIVSYAA
ncbi:hypothetical protein QVD17_02526 [Tagetes erecta]|uniref:F-box domain-containing protein n=1 Tax=Tagetes erecta TaxID=13708 RepID=A0AAD8P8X8_TARER|nr:hypothetical protein QVD17_02526 [Tagetes erecta]